jgi:Zn-dependent protease
MNASIRLGRVAGIEIGLNWSWLVVFGLITWSLAVGIFPSTNPGLGEGTYVVMGLVAAALFFTSILLHEFSHAIQARREGMEIEGITLWLFGGVAQFKGMFRSAGAEFRIAIAGPLVSLALGLAFIGVAVVISGAAQADAVFAWLGYINLSLLAFNLLPALPLDGGRVLRSALWAARGDFRSATHIAAAVGRGFGFVFIALGLLMAFWTSTMSGLWLAFIGWFLLAAASSEARYAQMRAAFAGRRVGDLMVRSPATVSPAQTIAQVMDEVVWTHRHTTYPVVEEGRAVGLLPFRCVAQVPRRDWDYRSVGDCMLPLSRVPTLREDVPLEAAATELSDGVGRALVLDGERLVGLLSITDLVRALELGGVARRGGGGAPR